MEKTGLIIFINNLNNNLVHWWAASIQLLLAQVLTKITVKGACLSWEKGGAAAVNWLNLTVHLWVTPPSAKKILLLTAVYSAWVLSLWMFLLPLVKDFLPWVLPLKSCRKQTNPDESVKAHFLVKRDVDAAQATSIILQTVLLGSSTSFPSLSYGSEEAAAGTWRMSVQRMFAVLGLFVVSLFLMQCFDTTVCCLLS